MTEKCAGCGFESKDCYEMRVHARDCKQFQEFKQLIINDAQTPKLIKELGLGGAARRLGINTNTFHHWFDANGNYAKSRNHNRRLPKGVTKQSDSLIIELTEEQIIRVLRKMIEEHDELVACKSRVATLVDQLKHLTAQVQNQEAVIKRMNEERLQPLRVKIEREAIQQSRDAH